MPSSGEKTGAKNGQRRTRVAAAASALAVLALVAAWKAAASRTASDLILPPPEKVLAAFFALCSTKSFALALGATLLRGIVAFAASYLPALVLALLASRYRSLHALVSPFLLFARSTPVLAVIVLLLIWFPGDLVPVVAAFLMAFPVAYSGIRTGASQRDAQLDEMASVYRLGKSARLRYIVLPSLAPWLASAAHSSLSLIWKVIVAGEVLSQPRHAIGTGLQSSKAYMEIPRALAWALATTLICLASDAAFALAGKALRSMNMKKTRDAEVGA